MNINDVAVFDVEADGLSPTKLWCLAVKDEKGLRATHSYGNMRSFFSKAEVLAGHNIIRFDIPAVERLLGITVKAKLVDTLALSWYLYPDRRLHGLEAWGEEFGVPKPEIDDWENLTLEEYIHRCKEDVKINTLLWEKMWNDLMNLYGDEGEVWRFIDYLMEKMDCAREQERSRWKLDVDKCRQELEKLSAIKEETFAKLKDAMPKVRNFNKRKRPAKPFKKDGTYSTHGARWFHLVRETYPEWSDKEVESFNGEIDEFVSEEDGNPDSHVQIKDWLYSLGWKPETFKYQRDKETGDIREIPQINLEHGAGICPSVVKLFDSTPSLKLLEGLGILSHRISILSGFLSSCDVGGYVQAQINGLTNTLRFKHKTVVNLPKVGKPYGDIIRGVLIAPDGYELCGSDMSSLEDRLKQHFIYKYDPKYVEEMNRDDYDPHLSLAVLAKAITPEQMQAYSDGTDKSIKPIRDQYKGGNYSCQYGAGPPRLALGLGISLAEAKKIHEAYWKMNWAIKKVAEDQRVRKIGGQMWLQNPINGFWYSLRTEKDRFSTLVQGSASYVFDLWVSTFRQQRPQLTGQFHDEVVLCVRLGAREKATNLLRSATKKLMNNSNSTESWTSRSNSATDIRKFTKENN